MSKLPGKLKEEVRKMIPVILYFLVGFELLALTQALMLKEFGIRTSSFLGAAIAALVVGKAIVIADLFKFVNRFPNKPLICNILWKTGIYFAVSFAFRYLEHLFHFWRQSSSFSQANLRMSEEIVWPHFWCVQLWLFVLLLVYCTIVELTRTIGREKIRTMFFGGDPKSAAAPASS